MIRHLYQTLRLLGLSLLAGAAWVAHRAADLPNAAAPTGAKADDLLETMRLTTLKRTAVLEISEAELNRHLATTLTGKVEGTLGQWASFDGARIDLEPGVARLILIWKIRGHTLTASVDLAVSRNDKNFQVELLRGDYGHLQMPRGMMRPLQPSLRAVAEALDPEIRALFQMTQITIAKDKLVLDPLFPSA